ncbi:MAG: sodium:proton antiporter NhaD [Methylococcaceae bacterium]|nr:sodium:proton antiporter NhaD [Methylococcaceae bacterium]
MPTVSLAVEATGGLEQQPLDLTRHWVGYLALILFAVAYILAMTEEVTELRKSKPMVFAASLIWVFIAAVYANGDMSEQAGLVFRAVIEGYAELFLFILVSMTYLNAMEDRSVFERLRVWLLSKNFTYRQLFWITGFQAFFISSACNNLTTALLMGSVIIALGKDSPRFVTLSCINVVVATNAGGSFSPFGDITTLLVWQKGVVPFADFFSLLIPALVNLTVPATIMHFFIPKERPAALIESQPMKRGGWIIIGLFVLTIITSACFENFLGLPPAAGMMLGLTYLKFFSFYLQKTPTVHSDDEYNVMNKQDNESISSATKSETSDKPGYIDYFGPMKVMNRARYRDAIIDQPFDVFNKVANLEWDTLLFFYGVMVAVGGLSFIGYLKLVSQVLYVGLDPTVANILIGIASAFVDNGTIMLAVLTMAPDISQGQWLLVTLTAGVGGSMLAVGSAAGVGLMGQAKGVYTFMSHLRWMPAIMLGYFASIAAHFIINSYYF